MSTWADILSDEKQQPYFQQIIQFVENERAAGKTIYPPEQDVFNAFSLTKLDDVKVVILGQDPYHGPNQAHGLCFSAWLFAKLGRAGSITSKYRPDC